MRIAHIVNGAVFNVIEGDAALIDGNEYIESATANIGDTVTNGAIVAQPQIDTRNYQEKRIAEYPPMSDYLDGLVKGDKAQMQAYIDACLAIKEKYPKP